MHRSREMKLSPAKGITKALQQFEIRAWWQKGARNGESWIKDSFQNDQMWLSLQRQGQCIQCMHDTEGETKLLRFFVFHEEEFLERVSGVVENLFWYQRRYSSKKGNTYLFFDLNVMLPFQNKRDSLHNLLSMSTHYFIYML